MWKGELRRFASYEDEVVAPLKEVQRWAAELASRDGRVTANEYFFAEQQQ
jgi:hypothetical protein